MHIIVHHLQNEQLMYPLCERLIDIKISYSLCTLYKSNLAM